MRKPGRTSILGAFAAGVLVCVLAVPASATFPGANGEIAFWRQRPGEDRMSLRTVLPDGARGRVLWPEGDVIGGRFREAAPFDVEWSPDGQQVAFHAIGSTLGWDRILVGDPDTGERTVILRPHRLDEHIFTASLSFAPSGDTLLLCFVTLHRANTVRLYTIGANGSNLSPLSDRSLCSSDWSVTDRIVAVAGSGQGRLITMDPDGTSTHVVVPAAEQTPDDWRLAWPSWSPDGSRIVYAARVGRMQHFDLFSIGADGTDRIRLTSTPGLDEAFPLFSPDGASIVFSRSEEIRADQSDLFSMSTDGSIVQRLTDTPRTFEEPRSYQPVVP